jgi:hypothetical protein
VSFLRQHRRCNECDDRDQETFVESTTIKHPLCCKKCGASKDKKPPCAYKAHFECVMWGPLQTDARGEQHNLLLSDPLSYEDGRFSASHYDSSGCHTTVNGMVWLRPFCNYQDSCTFLSIQDIPNPDYWRLFEILLESGYGNRYYNHYANHRDVCFFGLDFDYGFPQVCSTCSWQDRMIVNWQYVLPIARSEIKFGWKLDLNDLSSVTLNYAEHGLTYSMKAGEVWDCFAKNTLYLTTGNNPLFSNIPNAVCVTPIEETESKICDSINRGAIVYNNEANRCDCCDNYCDCIPGTIRILCGSGVQNGSVQYCLGGRTGVQDPVGPSREACAYFNDTTGTPHLICVVIYCTEGGVWKADWYCDGTYDGTVTLSSTCCPLTASGNGPPLSCMDCTGCVGISVDPGCQPPLTCCPLDSFPNTMTLTMYTTCVGWPATVTLTKGGTTWTGTFFVGGDQIDVTFDPLNPNCTIFMQCVGHVGQTFVMTPATCNPPTLTGSNTAGIFFSCGCGAIATIALVLG